jgi:hypothetical protein
MQTMPRVDIVAALVLAALLFSPITQAQDEKPRSPAPTVPALDGWGRPIVPPATNQKPGPAPKHDISGIWDPPRESGVQPLGADAMKDDGNPQHQPPYTPAGLEALKLTKPSNGFRSVLPTETNDPVFSCNPQGIPREDLYELRTTQILQTPEAVLLLYTYGRIWRVIWTDGRELPKDAEPRWFGYSVGKWVDDYTLVAETSGTDERTWIDRAGRPHSADLRVEERFHRVDGDHLEFTVTIDDPKMYTKPWIALDKFRFALGSPHLDIHEMICSPAEFAEYNKLVGDSISEKKGQ